MLSINERHPFDDMNRETTCRYLNILLADEFALFTKTLNYHWNITGRQFQSLHSFLETEYKSQLTILDELAERIKILGSVPFSTVAEMHKAMSLTEKNGIDISSTQMINNLYDDYVQMQLNIKDIMFKDDILKKDPGTQDVLTRILTKHEMTGWILRSHLE